MIGVIVNTTTVLVGSLFGLLLKKGVPKRITDALMLALGLCTLVIGFDGALDGKNTLVTVLSLCIGGALGTLLDLDGRLHSFSLWIQKKLDKGERRTVSVSEGLVTATLLFCVGSMTIVGSLQSGLTGDHQLIYTKSIMDMISSFALTVTLGYGVTLSAAAVFLIQGSLVLLAQLLAPPMTEYALYVIGEITAAGSVIIIAIGLNLLGITKIKCADYLPAIFIPLLLCLVLR